MQKHSSVSKQNLLRLLFTALLIFVPLYPKFPSIHIPGIYVSIRLEDFIIFTALIFGIYYLLLNKELFVRFISNKIIKSIIIFVFIGLVSLVSGLFLTQTASFPVSILHWIRRIEYFSLILVSFIFIRKYGQLKDIYSYILSILLIINFFVFLYGVGQRYFEFPVVTTQNEEYSKGVALRWVPGAHINSTFAGHYDLAAYIVLTLPLFINSFFVTAIKKEKIIFGISVLMGMWLLSVAVSRISIVAFMIAGGVSLFLLKKYKQILILYTISFLIFGFSADLRNRYQRIFDVVRNKLTTLIVVNAQDENEVFEDRSTSIRLNVEWPRAIRAFQKNPFLGTGYSSISLATDNDYLRLLGEVGLLGFLAFILIFINLFLKFKTFIFDSSIESIFKAGFIGSSIAALFIATFIDIFEASKFATMFWMFIGLII